MPDKTYVLQFNRLDGGVEQQEYASLDTAKWAFNLFAADAESAEMYKSLDLFSYDYLNRKEIVIDHHDF